MKTAVVGMGVPTTAASFRLFDILLKFSNLYTTMLKYLVSHIEIINNVMERFFNLLYADFFFICSTVYAQNTLDVIFQPFQSAVIAII